MGRHSDHDLQVEYQLALLPMVIRALAAPAGRALFTLGTAAMDAKLDIAIPDLVSLH